jgi:hypothetical protein
MHNNIENKWCQPCFNGNSKNNTSGNEKIDNLIQEMQLKTDTYYDIFEWIPYNQLANIKETGKKDFDIIYSAIWKNGPLFYTYNRGYYRIQNKAVTLKCLYNSQHITNEFLIKVFNFLMNFGAFLLNNMYNNIFNFRLKHIQLSITMIIIVVYMGSLKTQIQKII